MLPQDNNPDLTLEDEQMEAAAELSDMIDIQALAEEIFRLLKRELSLENERRGR